MREFLPLFSKPSRYLGCEVGAVAKDPDQVKVRVALAFPDLYEVGMSYLGRSILYGLVNGRPDAWAERVFAPSRDVAEVLKDKGAPLCTLESDTPLADMDLVAFSLTHELCYTNILYILDLAGLPRRAADRGRDMPLVAGGGGAAFNPEPVAAFFDFFVLGDGEAAFPPILDFLAGAEDRDLGREETLRELARLPGVYVPSLFADPEDQGPPRPLVQGCERVRRAVAPDLDAVDFPLEPVIGFGQVVHDRLTVEVARGCTGGCRFCHAGMVYRPVRERGLDNLAGIVSESLALTGYEELSFLSLSTGEYSGLRELFAATHAYCAARQVAISLPSLKVGSVPGEIMRLIAGIRRTGATIAPEAGSERLRRVINKKVTEEELMEHVGLLASLGWRAVKLYFMIGLPTETDEDVESILDLCLKVRAATGERGRRMQVTAAISPFVPKPHTPFQWEEQISLEEIRRRVGLLKESFRRAKGLSLKFHMPEMSWLEGVFSRGGRELAPVVEAACSKGALFSSWKDELDLAPWREALAGCGVEAEAYLRARDLDAPLPWDHLDCLVDQAFLVRERKRALEAKITPDCRRGMCVGCGVCDVQAGEELSPSPDNGPAVRPRLAMEKADGFAPGEAEERPDLTATACKVRVWYAKMGLAAHLSQLELQHVFERAIRRSRSPVSFTAGFHPMPRLSFGRALSVGVESACEWFDLALREAVDPDALRDALGAAMPQGLAVTGVEPLKPGKKAPAAVGEDFVLEFNLSPRKCAARLAEWERFMAQGTFVATRRTKRGQAETDIRPLAASAEPFSARAVRLSLDWRELYISPLTIVLAVNQGLSPLEFRLVKVAQHFGS